MGTEKSHAEQIGLAIKPYRDLLISFVAADITAEAFEAGYLQRYLADERQFSAYVFDVVDAFFADVDAFVGDPRLRNESQGDLSAENLRAKARLLLGAADTHLA